jgi:2-amino-4-hydroxy-6-hydroxymethyldihydropteridine diphosphokinase
MKGIYLLLGSNLGDSSAMLEKAKVEIMRDIGAIVNSSSVYCTKAWGIESQPDFLNQVIEVESDLAAAEILHKINKIEENLGRIRYIKWHSRIIDIDILYYGNEIINTEKLIVPHPENQHRNFVLVPMAEIAPELIHPKLLLTQKALLDNCTDKLEVKKNS